MKLGWLFTFRGLAGAFVLGAAIWLRVWFGSTALQQLGVNADEALTFLQAREIARGHFPLFFWTQPYQFPLEAYLLSYIVELLPWNVFGVRVVQLGLCSFAVVGFVVLLLRLARLQTAWPGLLMVLFPSVYWLSRQVALMTPQHAMAVTFAWMLPLILVISRASKYPHRWALAAGFSAGLAISNHLLSISLVVLVTAAICLGRSAKEALRNSLSFGPGFLLGSAPYVYAKLFIPGAYEKVADTVSLGSAMVRLWDPVVSKHVPFVLGIIPTYIPDSSDRVMTFRSLVVPTAVCFAILLIVLTVVRCSKFVQRWREARWPSVEVNDVFLGTTWLALCLMCLTGMDLRTRYALPVVWCFPFLLSYAYAIAPRIGRWVLGAVTFVLVAVNISGANALVSVWRQPGFSAMYAVLPDLTPLYAYFEQHGITRCYSAWWLSYRIIFDSKERIICSPPYNDRFRGWPQPYYREIVDRAENVPYIENTSYSHYLLRRDKFREFLNYHRIEFEQTGLGRFVAFHNFRHRDVSGPSIAIPAADLTVEASHEPHSASLLADDSLATVWSSGVDQAAGMSIAIRLNRELPIHAVQLFSLDRVHETEPPRVRVEVLRTDGTWRPMITNSIGHPHLTRLASNVKPEPFSGLKLTFGFEPVLTGKLRIAIDKPSKPQSWRLAELRVLTEAPSEGR